MSWGSREHSKYMWDRRMGGRGGGLAKPKQYRKEVRLDEYVENRFL